MSIDTETARKVAKLARIKVEDADLPALAEDFNRILGFVEQLNEVDVEGVEPMVSVTPKAIGPQAVDVALRRASSRSVPVAVEQLLRPLYDMHTSTVCWRSCRVE